MIWIVTLFEFLLGALMHFAYDVFPYSFVAIVAPTDESIFEHLKLVLYPMLLMDVILWCCYFDKDQSIFLAMLVGMIVGIMSVVLIYYFYNCGLGVNSLIVDILLLFVGLLLGNMISILTYRLHWILDWKICLFILVGIVCLFSYWTFKPPHIPLFIDFSK